MIYIITVISLICNVYLGYKLYNIKETVANLRAKVTALLSYSESLKNK
jgi:hypothetical protein